MLPPPALTAMPLPDTAALLYAGWRLVSDATMPVKLTPVVPSYPVGTACPSGMSSKVRPASGGGLGGGLGGDGGLGGGLGGGLQANDPCCGFSGSYQMLAMQYALDGLRIAVLKATETSERCTVMFYAWDQFPTIRVAIMHVAAQIQDCHRGLRCSGYNR